ncbi:MAG: IPT/TIG domain-containing protein, partial [Thermoleophilia bacterium]|nr:IPT/TIG domain-containing protein [Thermoleophilia bacterium]
GGDISTATGILTIGNNFPDAIGVSALACARGWPIILTDVAGGPPPVALHSSAAGTFSDLGLTTALKAGTYAELPGGVTGLTNFSGTDRYYTCANAAAWAQTYAGLTFTHTALTTGDKFPDALAGGPYVAQDEGMLLLSPTGGPLPAPIAALITANGPAVEHFTFIACIEPVIGQVKALLPDPPVITGVSPACGPAAGGTVVTISGSGFSGATAVGFGGVPATTFTVDSANQITATAPPGAGTVDVTVTTPAGASNANLADRYRYIPFPVITGLAPSSGSTSGGTEVTISGSGLSGATAVLFGSVPAASFRIDSANQITAATPEHGSATVDVTVTTPGGTSVADGAAGPANDFTFLRIPEIAALSPTWGPATGGTAVTITGANFLDATAVQFGGTDAATFVLDSDTQITANSPAHEAGPFYITVSGPEGTSLPVDKALFRFGSPVRYEEDDPLIVYAGDWNTAAYPSASAGTITSTSAVGAQVRAAFTGTSIDWIARTAPEYGLATVSLDGAGPMTVDLSSETAQSQQVVWSSGSLSEGLHTITLFCPRQPGEYSTGLKINVDAFDIVGTLTELPPEDTRDGLIVIDGSSLAAGSGSTPGNDWATRMVADISNPTAGAWIKANVAKGGQTIAQMAADAVTEIDTLFSAAYHHNICVVWEGCVSIDHGYSATQVHDELKAYCLARKAAGYQVVLLTVLPFGNVPPYEPVRSAANALIRSDWEDYADTLADVCVDEHIGDPGDQYDTTYYLDDAWHLNDIGQAIVADIVRAAIEGIL